MTFCRLCGVMQADASGSMSDLPAKTASSGAGSFAGFLRDIRTGDAQAAAELVRRYEPAIRLEVRLHLRNSRLRRVFDSMDVCQSVLASFFVRAAAGQYDLEQPAQLLKLLVAIARNKVADQARKERAQCRDNRRIADVDVNEAEVAAGGASPSQVLAGAELHGGPVSAVAFSPDSQTLATGSWDHMIKLWNLATGRLRATLVGHRDKVGALAFSPDGKVLGSVGLDQAVRLWDVAAAREQAVFAGQQVQPYRLAFSPDGNTLAWGSFGAVKLRDLRTGQERLIHLDGGPVIGALAFRRDGMLAAAGNDGTLRLFDGATGRHLADLQGHTGHVPCLVFAADGKALASAGTDGTVRLWDVDSRKELATLRSHAGIVNFVAFTGDGHLLVSGGTDNAVRLWDLATRQLRQTWQQKRVAINCGAASPDGRTLAWGDADGRVTLWNGTAGQWLLDLGSHMARAAAYSPDGKSLALATYGQVLLLDAGTGRELAALHVPAPWAWAVAFSPDGSILATAEGDYPQSGPGVVRLWDAVTRQPLAVLQGHRHAVYALAFAPDGKALASGGGDGEVKLWDVATCRPGAAFTVGESGRMVRAVAFAPDGKTFAAGSSSEWSNVPCQVKLWDPATGQERATLQGFTGVEALAFNPDSRTLALAGYDQAVRLWDVAAGTERRVLEGHTQTVTSLAFLPGGHRLASGSIDGSVNLWDPDTGEEVATLPNHHGSVYGVAFSPDGDTLATAAAGWAPAQTVHFWRAPRSR